MQKVERKKHGERRVGRAGWVVLCALVLALCVGAGVLLTRKAEEKPEPGRQPVTGSIVQRSPEELESMTITPRGKEAWTAVRMEDGTLGLVGEGLDVGSELSQGEGFQEEGFGREESSDGTKRVVPSVPPSSDGTKRVVPSVPPSVPIDSSIGEMLVDAAVHLTYEDVFTENRADWEADAADFGLKDPLVTAVFRYTDGTEKTVRIGDSADPEDNVVYYMTVDGDDRLYAVGAGTVKDLSTDRNVLIPVPKLQIHSALLDRITVQNGDGSTRIEWVLNGDVADQDAAENWMLTAPVRYPADYEAMKNLKDSAEQLRLGMAVGPATEESLEEYGLKEPTAVLEMHMAAGSTGTVGSEGVYDVSDWEERTKTLTIGKAKSDMVDYVLYEGKVYTISRFSVSAFTETEALSTVARYLVATPLNSLESVTVDAEGKEPVRYGLIRFDEEQTDSSDGSAESERTIRCMRNGEEIPYETFAAAYERMLTVTVSGKLPEEFEAKEAHTKYTFRTVSGGTHMVELCDYDGIHDAVVMDGCMMFYLIKGGMTELP